MIQKKKILVVIPTYNCEKQISRVINKISSFDLSFINEIDIIDNSSTDNTIASALTNIQNLQINKIKIYKTVENNSLGGTHKIAFDKAIAQGYDYVAIFHGDDQADFSNLVDMCKIISNSYDNQSFLGSRFSRKSKLIGYSKKRIFGNIGLNIIYSIKNFKILTDLGSGLNVFHVDSLERINYHNFNDSLSFNYELLLGLVSSKSKFVYYPIIWSETDQNSNLNNMIAHGFNALRILFISRKSKINPEVSKRVYKIVEIQK
jgi:glycosyltransferase involved in cell wall biosynthesis